LDQVGSTCDNARFNLNRSREQERLAVENDQAVVAKMDELRNHLNTMTNKPASLMEMLSSLGADQEQTYRQRQAAGEAVRRCQRELTDAEAKRGIVVADLKKIDHDIAELDAQIREVRGYSL
jgi:chromosome segregation ATPase